MTSHTMVFVLALIFVLCRDSHLIFSIDPVGCEDIDDALSVRWARRSNLSGEDLIVWLQTLHFYGAQTKEEWSD